MINDEESLIRSIRDYVKDNLNTKIVAINTEKGDFEIEQLKKTDERFMILGERGDLPLGVFVQFAFENIDSLNIPTDSGGNHSILAEVAFDNPKNNKTPFISFRYMRALREVMEDYEASTIEVGGMQITNLIPLVVTATRRELVVSGVRVIVGIS